MTCRYTKWALEMERAAQAMQEEGLPANVVRGNRNVALLLRMAADTEAKLQKLCRGIADRMADCGRDNSLLSAMDKAERQMLVDAGLWREPGA